MERKANFLLGLFILFGTISLNIASAESHFGSDISVFQGRAVVPQDAPEKKAFVDLYLNERRGSARDRGIYRQEFSTRRNQFLTKQVLSDFHDALGNTADLAIIYAEGINNNPMLGGKGKIDHFRETARTFSELLGSLPRDEEKTMGKKIEDLRDRFESRREQLEKDSDLTPEEKEELNYLKLALWSSDEATKMLKEGASYKAPEGDEQSTEFRKEFAKAFDEKLERNRKEHELFKKAASGDAEAKAELISRNPITLLVYAAQAMPMKAAEAIRALGLGENNEITLYDENNKEIPVVFGKTEGEIQATLDKWRDRYQSGSFSLQPLAGKEVVRSDAPVPDRAGASDNNLSRLAPRNTGGVAAAPPSAPNLAQNPALLAAQQQAARLQAERARAAQIVQQRAQQFNASRRAQGGQVPNNQGQANFIRAQNARQAALARFNLARLLESRRRASSLSYKVRSNDSNLSPTADPEGFVEARCVSCHDAGTLPERIRAADPNGMLAQMPLNGTPMDETEKQALINWANSI